MSRQLKCNFVRNIFYNYTLAIDDLIIKNPEAKKNFDESNFRLEFYDYRYTKLEKNLCKIFE